MANPEHTDAVMQALADFDKATRACIADELTEQIPAYEAKVDAAAENLRNAVAALEIPQREILEIEAELSEARTQELYWRQHGNSKNHHDRVESAVWADGYSVECVKITHRLEQAQDAVKPFKAAVDEARKNLANAQDALSGIKLNAEPENAYMGYGQFTESYKLYRRHSWALTVEQIAVGESYNSERDAFFEGLDMIAESSGYRTDDLQERLRQSAIADARANMDAVFPERSHAPSGQDVIAETNNAMQHQGMQKANERTRLEDYRHPVPSGVKVPRPEMQVPTAASLRGRR